MPEAVTLGFTPAMLMLAAGTLLLVITES